MELLVVVMIIVILFGILLPVIIRAIQGGETARMRMDLQAISVALEAYKADHRDYPRDINYASNAFGLSGAQATAYANYRGAVLLTRALVAPGPEKETASGRGDGDGAEGPGFRINPPVGGGPAQGRIFGPYIKTDSFTIANADQTALDPDNPDFRLAVMQDKGGKPILYFPGRSTKPDLTGGGGSTPNPNFVNSGPGSGGKPLYNQEDNEILDLEDMRRLLGDTNNDGAISGAEKAATTGPFLLWTAGPDGVFGTDDDITNFNE